jgi:hypothetical protein
MDDEELSNPLGKAEGKTEEEALANYATQGMEDPNETVKFDGRNGCKAVRAKDIPSKKYNEIKKALKSLTEDANKEVKIAKFGDYPVGNKKVKIAGFVDCSGSHRKDSIKNQINILKNAGATEIYYFSGKVCTDPESA